MGRFIDDVCGGNDLQSVFIEAWKKEVFFRTFTLADMDWANKMAKGNDGEFIAYTIIRKALDENGDKLFSVADKQKMMRSVQSDILSSIVIRMKGEDVENIAEMEAEEYEKNSEAALN